MAKKGLGLHEMLQSAISRPRLHTCFLDRMDPDVAADLVAEVKAWLPSQYIRRTEFILVVKQFGAQHGDEHLASFTDGKLCTIEDRIRAGVL